MWEIPGGRVPIRLWADPAEIEDTAMQQLRHAASLPWAHGLAVMPDVHYGRGATVGSVIALRDAVSPAAVGVDIGCGMSAVRTSLTADDLPENLARLRHGIENAVPVGFGMHDKALDPSRLGTLKQVGVHRGWADFVAGFDELAAPVGRLHDRAFKQLGSLGGGNHFVEVCLETGDDGEPLPGTAVWLMLHSGSRGIGNELAKHHIDIARGLPFNADLPDPDLAVFVAYTPQMAAYRRDLFWAQEYARRNRALLMALVMDVVVRQFRKARVQFGEVISCHHNYVAEEVHDGVEVLVTRKGAIRAAAGEMGIIPGSMGTGSYIVRGLGNPASFHSASHGAGRRMSRGAARRTFTTDDLIAQTAGVECRKDRGVVDEIPGAYKDVKTVIAAQADLVEVVTRLKQVVCVKG